MKKAVLLIATFAALAGACKKTYVCECTDPTGSVNQSYNIENTKSKAKKQCDSYAQQAQSGSFSNVTCQIKN